MPLIRVRCTLACEPYYPDGIGSTTGTTVSSTHGRNLQVNLIRLLELSLENVAIAVGAGLENVAIAVGAGLTPEYTPRSILFIPGRNILVTGSGSGIRLVSASYLHAPNVCIRRRQHSLNVS
jgi:hypothetical protein